MQRSPPSTSLSLNGPQPLPSLPPSPTTEEDVSSAPWTADEIQDTPRATTSKGKGRERLIDSPGFGYTYSAEGPDSPPGMSADPSSEGYPPTNDDEAETRRIEENLRRWEMAERQRRKAARVSTLPPSTSNSLVGDVSRRASLLWPTKRRQNPPSSPRVPLGIHAALKSRESLDAAEVVPLDRFSQSTTYSTPNNSTPDVATPVTSTVPKNPFTHPKEEDEQRDGVSPFEDQHQTQEVVMNPSPQPPTPFVENGSVNPVQVPPKRPVLEAKASSFVGGSQQPPPPPRPLNLPPPRSPPLTAQPAPIPQPSRSATTSTSNSNDDLAPYESRWWHDWLCGCGEGADRGGDNQAGRTNPFE